VVHKRPPYPSGRVAASQKSQVSTSQQNDENEKNTCNNNDQS
jgi:hypothetical protein